MKKRELYIGITLFLTTAFQNLVGLLSNKQFNLSEVINVYGETIELYGIGIYRFDSVFKAMIFIGTDFAVLVFVLPLFLYFMFKGIIKGNLLSKFILLGITTFLVYFHSSVALGVFYNQLHLLYIINFILSVGLFAILVKDLNDIEIISDLITRKSKVLIIYLIINLLALIFAWVPEIIYTTINNTGISFGFHYTTESTHLLDLGIIVPLISINIYYLFKNNSVALKMFVPLLMMSLIIGVVVVLQTMYQLSAGIELSSQEVVTKVIPFVINSIYSIIVLMYFKNRVTYGLD